MRFEAIVMVWLLLFYLFGTFALERGWFWRTLAIVFVVVFGLKVVPVLWSLP